MMDGQTDGLTNKVIPMDPHFFERATQKLSTYDIFVQLLSWKEYLFKKTITFLVPFLDQHDAKLLNISIQGDPFVISVSS